MKLKFSLTLVLLIIAFGPTCFVQAIIPSSSEQKNSTDSKWTWTDEKWNGNDTPYVKIRQSIDKAIAAGQKPDTLLKKYQVIGKAQPSNPQAQFQWAYAAWQARKAVDKYKDQYQKLSPVREVLVKVTSPATYQYVRLRFVIEAWFFPASELKFVGERLIKRNPNDYDVKYYLVSILDTSTSSAEWKTALKYAKDLIRIDSKRSSAYSALGGVYFASWLKTKNKLHGKEAINAYRKYLVIAPKNAEWRAQAERLIKTIQKEQAK